MVRVGIDVGGTGIQVGVLDQKNRILAEESIPTNTSIPFSEQIHQLATCIFTAVASAGVKMDRVESVGAGIPGIANMSTGVIIKCPNMGWYHVPFRGELQKYFQVPILIDNDANVAALAESVAGVSAGTSSSVFITIGTGIGSGIILNGKIWSGFHGIGSELGHVILDLDGVPCSCGNHGCLERYCSATALIRMGREAVQNCPESLILKSVSGNPDRINARTVIDAAREKDPVAVEVYDRYIQYLSQAIANVVNLIDPEIIVLGGGVSKAGDFLLDAIRKTFPKYVLYDDQPMPDIRLAVLGPEAGIIGAAMLS
ncbi:MAG: ROK family glucokinase [Clostridia bacterium]|nr:ROK family glucokinase [Clostridia bacterium]